MRKLVEICDAVGVPKQNSYVFPYTQASVSHVSSWHAVKGICTAANVLHPERRLLQMNGDIRQVNISNSVVCNSAPVDLPVEDSDKDNEDDEDTEQLDEQM